ncbi:RNA 2',3'-cyclic phosphodiesterase [Emcibacter sp.]|uniref:RNA 2',3'-cyclic phosphodiesterase n=1 Tax=Emcibacter sp. TaxID=1979954 RepID=UPI003A8D5C65
MNGRENGKAYQRLFMALRPDEAVVKALGGACIELKRDKAFEGVRWMRPENLHVTLVFLGRQSAEDASRIAATMTEVAPRHQSFDIVIEGLQTTRNNWQKGVLMAMVRENDSLRNLQLDLARSLASLDIEGLDQREYMPHVTLARLKQERISPDQLSSVNFSLRQQVRTMGLYESITLETGAVYTLLKTVQLGSRA